MAAVHQPTRPRAGETDADADHRRGLADDARAPGARGARVVRHQDALRLQPSLQPAQAHQRHLQG